MDLMSTVVALGLVLLSDWAVSTRLAAYFPEIDYGYWPLGRLRKLTLLSMLLMTATLVALSDEGFAWWALVLPSCLAIAAWITAIYLDVQKQVESGGSPKRYSERAD